MHQSSCCQAWRHRKQVYNKLLQWITVSPHAIPDFWSNFKLTLTGWSLSWKSGKSGKGQEKVREMEKGLKQSGKSQGIWEKKEESQRKVRDLKQVFRTWKFYHSLCSIWWSQLLPKYDIKESGEFLRCEGNENRKKIGHPDWLGDWTAHVLPEIIAWSQFYKFPELLAMTVFNEYPWL